MTTHIKVPQSGTTVSVSIVDTTSRMLGVPTAIFLGPPIPGFDTWSAVAYSFLVTHLDPSTGRQQRLLFDLGTSKDWQHDISPEFAQRIQAWVDAGVKIHVEKELSDILAEHGVNLGADDALIWSHPHWDHMGKCSSFDKAVPLVVGPGLKAAFGGGYPENKAAPFLATEIEGREVREISDDEFARSGIFIGDLRAFDWFGDGSFYLLDAPGHCIAHVMGLARVAKDEFILMGADSFHHPSQVRPSNRVPLPDTVSLQAPTTAQLPSPCPGELFNRLYTNAATNKNPHYEEFLSSRKPGNSPFITIAQREDGGSVAADPPTAREVIGKVQKFDADDNVLVVAAHDISLLDVMEFFPKSADNWKTAGWKDKGRWRFLNDFERSVLQATANI